MAQEGANKMFLIKEKRKNGTYLSIVQSYRDPVTKATKRKRIKNIGYLEDLEKEYDDPIAHFQQVAKEMSEEYAAETKPIQVALDQSKSLEPGIDLTKNLGYTALSALYHELKINVFFRGRQRDLDIDYNLNSIMKLLVYGNILYPGSIRHIYNRRNLFFDKMEFSLEDIYDSFRYLKQYKVQLQRWMYKYTLETYKCKTDKVYYYITKQYFEPELQKLSSDRRTDPIVQLDLITDTRYIPLSYEVSSRAPSDILTVKASIAKRLREMKAKDIVLIGDNGINSPDNLYNLIAGGYGYIVQQSLRTAEKDIKDFVLKEQGYIHFGTCSKLKSRIITRTIKVTTPDGKKKNVQIKEKQIAFYNQKYARCVLSQREDMLLKANDLIAAPGTFDAQSGSSKHAKTSAGDCSAKLNNVKIPMRINEEQLKEEEKYDGYYFFLTSEIEEDDFVLLNAYSRLWETQSNFDYTNNIHDLPKTLTRENHLHSHYLTHFVSLVITRILESKVDHKYSLDQLVKSLYKCTCVHIEDNNYVQCYFDTILDDIGQSIGVDFSKRYGTLCKIKENIAITKKKQDHN